LEYCHSRGVMHRNIKPKHLLVKLKPPPQLTAGTAEADDAYYDGMYLQGAELVLSDFALVRAVSPLTQPARVQFAMKMKGNVKYTDEVRAEG
jgi:serine/threonine protein kinase